jgi:CBS domain containing-hemolysin-like protein
MDALAIIADFPGHLLVMLCLLAASAFFSASETALFNLTREQLRRFRASRSPLRQLAARLMDNPRHLLVTVLFGNMTVNTAFFVMGVMLVEEVRALHPQHVGVWRFIVATLTPLAVILFGEVTPKSLAAAIPERIAPLAGPALTLLGYVVNPVRVVLGYVLVVPTTRLVRGGRREEHSYVTADELQAIVEVAAREGAVSSQESDMLSDILELGDLRVSQVMKPRVEIVGCDRITPMAIALAVFRRTRCSKMVVYEDEMDNVCGIVEAKTAFLNPDRSLSDLLRPVYYVPETKRVEDLLKEFRARQIQFAVAVDEYGGVAGLVTLEDCIEQIVGSIEDETDRSVGPQVQRVSDQEYLLAGNLSIRSWADAFDIEVPDGGSRYSTVAGLLTVLLGRLPRAGDVVEWRNLAFTVEEVRHHRVTRVRLRLRDEAAAQAAAAAGRAATPKGGR